MVSITTGYIVAGAFEVLGVAWVVGDVYLDRRRARTIVAGRSCLPRSGKREWLYGGLTTQRRGPHAASSHRAEKEGRKRTWD